MGSTYWAILCACIVHMANHADFFCPGEGHKLLIKSLNELNALIERHLRDYYYYYFLINCFLCGVAKGPVRVKWAVCECVCICVHVVGKRKASAAAALAPIMHPHPRRYSPHAPPLQLAACRSCLGDGGWQPTGKEAGKWKMSITAKDM